MSVTNNFKRKSFAGQNSSTTPANGTQIKRPKRYEFDRASTRCFDEERNVCSRANDDDEEDFGNDDPAFDDADQENKENAVELGQGPAYEATNVKWSRPDIPAIDPSTFKLVFQQIDLDTYADTDATPQGLDASRPHLRAPHTVIRLYGVTDEGYSVMAHLHGYIPYFYASVPSDTFTAADCERFKVNLSQTSHISGRVRAVLFFPSKISMPPYVVKCEERMSSPRTSSWAWSWSTRSASTGFNRRQNVAKS